MENLDLENWLVRLDKLVDRYEQARNAKQANEALNILLGYLSSVKIILKKE